MATKLSVRSQITAAAESLWAAMEAHPECRADTAEAYIRKNERRPYPLLTITPAPYDVPEVLAKLNAAPQPSLTVEERILQGLLSAALSVQMLNPIAPVLHPGRGPGTLAASFGIALDPALGYQPVGARDIDDVLAEGMPDVENSGILPDIRAHIEAIRALTPSFIQIAAPDTQGPFNIAHMVLGNDAFLMPLLEPEKFDELMTMITDFYIAFYQRLREWIGPERYTIFVNARCRLRECSVNLISESMYLEHVLRHDMRIAEFFGEICIHPCSGRHVFNATIRNLPNIVYHEAMPFANAAAPNITIEEAVQEIGNRPIRLCSSRSLCLLNAYEIITSDFAILREHPAFVFTYELSDATAADKEEILRLHRRLIDEWHAAYQRA